MDPSDPDRVRLASGCYSLKQKGRMSEEPVKNLVLVHGGFVDGSGWQGVYDLLIADGYRAKIVQNPTVSLARHVSAPRMRIGGWRSHLRDTRRRRLVRSPRADRFTQVPTS